MYLDPELWYLWYITCGLDPINSSGRKAGLAVNFRMKGTSCSIAAQAMVPICSGPY